MSRTNDTINSVKGLSTLSRPRFSAGMLLQHEDLEQLHMYTRDLSRLMFRSLFGCGVVCGLVVSKPEPDPCGKLSITVTKGLALDCCGDPIQVPKDQSLPLDEKCEEPIPSRIWVLLCPNDKCCSPRTSMCGSDEEESSSVCTRERDGFEIRIVRALPDCICGCRGDRSERESECACVDPNDSCYAAHYRAECDCDAGEDCGCRCECVLLAQLDRADGEWTVDHSVRRLTRPVLMRDPVVARELAAAQEAGRQIVLKKEQQQLAKKHEQQLAKERQRVKQKLEEQERLRARAASELEKALRPKTARAAKTTRTTNL